MEAMPRHDPNQLERAARAWARYKMLMTWMVLLAAVAVILALAWLGRSGDPLPIHLVVATVAGVFLTILVGTGLMGLVFLSNRGGHDDAAAGRRRP